MKLLQKGQAELLLKQKYDLSHVTVGSGWSEGIGSTVDIDLFSVLLGENGNVIEDVPKTKPQTWAGPRAYSYPTSGHINSSRSIIYGGDSKGGSGGDDETIDIVPNRVPSSVVRIMLVIVLYMGRKNGQSLSEVKDAYVRIVDAKGSEMLRYQLDGALNAPGKFSILFGELLRTQGGWAFEAVGEYLPFDSQIEFVQQLRDKPMIRSNPTLANNSPSPQPPRNRSNSAASAFDAMFAAARNKNQSSPKPPPPTPSPKKDVCPFCQGKGCHFCK